MGSLQPHLPLHVDRPTSRQVPFPQRSSSFSAPRPRNPSRDRPPPSQSIPVSQNAPLSRPVKPPDSQGANLNRWSKSTASSTTSQTHQRRMSYSNSFFDTTSSSPPRRSRPSTASQAGRTSIDRPLMNLPPLQTSSNLQINLNNSASPSGVPNTPSPSTAQILSAAARSVDYFGKSWDDPTLGPKDFSQKRTVPTSKTSNLSSSSAVDSGPSAGDFVLEAAADSEVSRARGHSRNRSQATKGSSGTGSSGRNSKPPSQKAMLSKALQKANTAVLLDNAQNFEGAMQAYSEACTLLQQVMLRSSGDEDRRKLEAIRNTYTGRINELRVIAPQLRDDGKALPARPESFGTKEEGLPSPLDDEEPVIIETATVTRIVNDQSYDPELQTSRMLPASQLPQRRESLIPLGLESLQYRPKYLPEQNMGRSYLDSAVAERLKEGKPKLAPSIDNNYIPPPLSPRRPSSPINRGSPNNGNEKMQSSDLPRSNLSGMSPSRGQGHVRAASNESMSWLDTIDESGSSVGSSVHSRTSSMGVRRKRIRAPSGDTEAEFDAALDAAVEAAYDDGLEPMDEPETSRFGYDDDDEVVAAVRRKVELAKERVRQSEREAAIQDAKDRERRRLLQQRQVQQTSFDDYDGNGSDEEEERMLEEMTRGYIMDDFEFGLQSKSALPRESDSSGFSGRTWNSSIGSNPTTAGTALSTVLEASSTYPNIANRSKTPPPLLPPPAQPLPPAPNSNIQPPVSLPALGVRSRRLSGQNAKQLKIETTAEASLGQAVPSTIPPLMPAPRLPEGAGPTQTRTATLGKPRQPVSGATARPSVPPSARQPPSPFPGPSPSDAVSPPTPTLAQNFSNDIENNGQLSRSGSPARTQSRSGLRKNFSSSSLKNMKSRNNLSVSNMDDGSDLSPNTPMGSQFNSRDPNGRFPAMPALPTPIALAFKDKMNGSSGGVAFFDGDFLSADTPGTPNPSVSTAPVPLEPCPTEFLLRPFWLMRALYQTLAHPRGGYISTKLFIPREVWQVKGVKLKSVEDKIANCDHLTAALMKLSKVDTFDADAVLEEMQSLEGVLEQVQTTLTKKLGSEVGLQGAGGMFKDTSNGGEAESGSTTSKSSGNLSKSSSFSWRRLRSKNSGIGLSNSYSNKAPVDSSKEGLAISSLPMTSTSVSKTRFVKRDISQIQFSGPNANYMNALARLFDAAQAIDQIARQVEDPGLRHADKTQVGLELCTRHAAEFFGFYICRFVLTDVGLLLDKFIKRGSEWVLV